MIRKCKYDIHYVLTGLGVLIGCGFCSFVGTFIPRKDRLKDMGHNTRFTNLYVKNFGDDVTDEGLSQMFEPYGNILSAVVMKDRNTDKSLGFGFVSFDNHGAAASVSAGVRMHCCVVVTVCVCVRA